MTRFSRRLSAVIATAVALTLTPAVWADGHAGSSNYDFKDPKGVNALLIIMDSELEPIVGMANGISGKVSYDPAKPTSLAGAIELDVQSIQLSNERMTQVMRGASWINAEAFGKITVTFNKVTEVVEEDGDLFLIVDATLEAMGKTLAKELEIEVDHFKDGAKERGGAESGDLLRLICDFEVTREELGIKPDMGDRVVANEIVISVAIVGYEDSGDTWSEE
ncbi:MAG: YceI family protein [Planctomycetota bacterium]